MDMSIWYLVGAALVFFMQAGFAMVEAGFTRAKNAGNIIMKNLMDFCIGTAVFILFGSCRFYCATGKRPLFCPFWFLHSLFLPVPCDGKSRRGLYPRCLPSGNLFCSCYSDTSSGLGIKWCSLRTADSRHYFSDCHRSYGCSATQRIADNRNPYFHSIPGALIT